MMDKMCPLISFHKEHAFEVKCRKADCMLWAEPMNDCLLAAALSAYVDTHTPISFPAMTWNEEDMKQTIQKLQTSPLMPLD